MFVFKNEFQEVHSNIIRFCERIPSTLPENERFAEDWPFVARRRGLASKWTKAQRVLKGDFDAP